MSAEWSSITIRTSVGVRSIRALVFGAWAAHERWPYPDGSWIVTHVETGLCLGFPGELSAADAISAAHALHQSELADTEELTNSRYLVESIIAEAIAEERAA